MVATAPGDAKNGESAGDVASSSLRTSGKGVPPVVYGVVTSPTNEPRMCR